MSDQGGDDAGETVGDESSSSRVRAPWSRKPPGEDPAEHSTLVGFMSVPVHRRFRLRRSTLLMAVAFVALGVVLYFNPTQSTSTVTVRGADGNYYQVPGAVLTAPTTTTTTTTRPPATTTTTSTLRSSTTTTIRSSTTTSLGSSTTTTLGGSGTSTTTTTSGSSQTPGTGTVGTSRSTTTTRASSSTTTTTTSSP